MGETLTPGQGETDQERSERFAKKTGEGGKVALDKTEEELAKGLEEFADKS